MTTPEQDPLRTVLRVLDLEQVDADTFTGTSLPLPGGRVFGGQVLAQAILAAGRTVEPDRLPHSAHGYFLRPGDVARPVRFAVERLRDGRSFSARRTHALQDGVPILSLITSFQVDQPGLDHADPAPPSVPAPQDLPSPLDQPVIDHPLAQFWIQSGAFELRHVEDSLFTGPGGVVTDRQMVWLRARGTLPDDPLLHRALLAFGCDQVMLEPVLRRHGVDWTTPGLSIASLDHAMWWHRPARADEWLLYVQASPSAQGGRGLGTAQVFTRDGALVATIAQEGMLRVPT
ncbi:acyl-CoA thioesterase II [Actinotalea sp.]|uniref:acyl-CoA thioesterase n=1 Tax=Actinotalea sp. TaxID=1872145 RepID=UPI002D12926F|nr:acyl-CoA thioesterase II [Actinotalea sp.]HQY33067.1 acyl-CoA thioesterase II [Actinotalea sp.]HRA49391.1 acyl-CoA thioesterase II [Actinotalea sp.]